MSLRQVLLPEAAEEIAEGVRWYEAREPGLGVEFLATVERAMDRVATAPFESAAWPTIPRFRRQVLRRFPYALVYEVRPDGVEFVAVAHTSRRPGYWLDRVR